MSSVLDDIDEKLDKIEATLMFPKPSVSETMHISFFNGEINPLTFTEFLEKFQLVARALEWTDKYRAHWMPGFLQVYALEVYRQLPDGVRGDYSQLIDALETKFAIPEGAQFASLEMRSRNLEPSEDITEFATELRKLTRAVYPSFPETAIDSDLPWKN